MIVSVSRAAHFNAAHRLARPDWSQEKNEEVFGKCANPNFHGHNYELIVTVSGEVNPETGYVIDMKHLADLIKREVEEPFDHRNLNLDVSDFAELIPTAEHIVVVIWRKLRNNIPGEHTLSVRLYETPRNFVDYHGR